MPLAAASPHSSHSTLNSSAHSAAEPSKPVCCANHIVSSSLSRPSASRSQASKSSRTSCARVFGAAPLSASAPSLCGAAGRGLLPSAAASSLRTMSRSSSSPQWQPESDSSSTSLTRRVKSTPVSGLRPFSWQSAENSLAHSSKLPSKPVWIAKVCISCWFSCSSPSASHSSKSLRTSAARESPAMPLPAARPPCRVTSYAEGGASKSGRLLLPAAFAPLRTLSSM
mmetsp:Transcript_62260/g.160550  ORF Transcript_62260/g.160550 Transcript_62260/m.160550 type:complete len:226 (+) Transcript_62260:290-967(+)